MREIKPIRLIKFRAWDNDCSEMVHDTVERIFGNHLEEYIMQYTGLKDKYGVDIYEGDIIRKQNFKYNPNTDQYMKNGSIFTKVVEYKRSTNCIGYSIGSTDDIEVIGNKIQNPDFIDNK